MSVTVGVVVRVIVGVGVSVTVGVFVGVGVGVAVLVGVRVTVAVFVGVRVLVGTQMPESDTVVSFTDCKLNEAELTMLPQAAGLIVTCTLRVTEAKYGTLVPI